MKAILRVVVICVGLLTIAAVNSSLWGLARPAFVLQISPTQNATQPGVTTWKSGTPGDIVLTMRNNSKHVLHFSLTNSAFNSRVKMLNSQGKPAPETDNFQKLRERFKSGFFSTRTFLVVLKPHQTYQETIELSYLYSLTAGEYTVQIERDMPSELGRGVVKSNIVKLTIAD